MSPARDREQKCGLHQINECRPRPYARSRTKTEPLTASRSMKRRPHACDCEQKLHRSARKMISEPSIRSTANKKTRMRRVVFLTAPVRTRATAKSAAYPGALQIGVTNHAQTQNRRTFSVRLLMTVKFLARIRGTHPRSREISASS